MSLPPISSEQGALYATDQLGSVIRACPSANEEGMPDVLRMPLPPSVIFNEWHEPRLTTWTPKLVCPSCLEVKARWHPNEKGNVVSEFMTLLNDNGDVSWISMVTKCCNEFVCNACQMKVPLNTVKKSKNVHIAGHNEGVCGGVFCRWHNNQ